MNRGNKLLDYVKLLDSSLQVGGFSHSFGLKSYIEEGTIQTTTDLETFMRCELHPSLVQLEGMAIKAIYTAVEQKDEWRIALIDKMLHVKRTPVYKRESSRAMGKRLIKLSKALHPWMDFEHFEALIHRYDAVGSLPVVHAWINTQLEVTADDAASGYLHAAKDVCLIHARRLLNIETCDLNTLSSLLDSDLEEEWNRARTASLQPFQNSILSMQSLIPGFPFHEPGIEHTRA
ncbi:urease accessory protein UreF [Paenibacillus urinalis]|uniref:Urease accessory UreF family protein n=1 Tax=Paenibacillus urinalis TaxID=521520 RepID=A0AAX3N2T6_9BACL|nr:urease accessory UreF family protein [Paenibacillus urinalis]WDH83867.1 urease accessory UreF family protein [Paenibacillus urinalis]